MNRSNWKSILGFALAAACALGCAPSVLDQTWGIARERNLQHMMVDPYAEVRPGAHHTGLDAASAETVMERHRSAERDGSDGRPRPSVINTGIPTR